jgi:HEAT repeat protein
LSQRAVEDKDSNVRAKALELLAGHEPWADEPTRQLLSQRAVEDNNWLPRAKALKLLAGHEPWADEPTRQLLSQRAVEDEHDAPRARALELLAGHEPWADGPTRQLLSQRAVEDENEDVRVTALELLAGHEPWADEPTRRLLSQRAVEDENHEPRAKALELLAGHEPWAAHGETLAGRKQFLEYIRGAAEAEERGAAACAWFGTVDSSDPLSEGKKRVFSRTGFGFAPYLDPRKPVADEHLAGVAEHAGLSEDRIDEMVEQMNETLGWDIRKGLGPIADDE